MDRQRNARLYRAVTRSDLRPLTSDHAAPDFVDFVLEPAKGLDDALVNVAQASSPESGIMNTIQNAFCELRS
jgi:hypothetical protein